MKISNLFLNEKFIFFIILLNSITVFLLGFNFNNLILSRLIIADSILTILFLVEMIFKLKSNGYKVYFNSNWNVFDFILVVLALPSLIDYFISHDFIDLNYLLAFRILRVFKFFRFIKFIPNIEHIIRGAFQAAKSSLLILIGFIIVNFLIGVISCFMFKDLSPIYFANPLESIYSIFKIFTVEGWYEIPDSVTENMESEVAIQLTRLYFIIVLFIGGIFGLSLVNSIFVDAMVSDKNEELENRLEEIDSKLNSIINTIKSNKSN
jgi:voltage-gated sodium channel